MSFFVRQPDEWIGVPERWPFETPRGFAGDPESWIADTAEALVEPGDVEGKQHVREVLTLAAQRGVRTGLRTFVGFEDYRGAAYIVESGVMDYLPELGQSLLQYMEFHDPDQVGPQVSEEFTTTSGLVGVRSYRYFRTEPTSEAVYGRLDYAFAEQGSILFMRGAEHNLVAFERLKRYIEPLANSVEWLG